MLMATDNGQADRLVVVFMLLPATAPLSFLKKRADTDFWMNKKNPDWHTHRRVVVTEAEIPDLVGERAGKIRQAASLRFALLCFRRSSRNRISSCCACVSWLHALSLPVPS